jgi:hypothetical protein
MDIHKYVIPRSEERPLTGYLLILGLQLLGHLHRVVLESCVVKNANGNCWGEKANGHAGRDLSH